MSGTSVGTGFRKTGSGRVNTLYIDDVAVTSSAAELNITDGLTATTAELNQIADISAYQETIAAAGALSITARVSKLALVGAGAVTIAAPDATCLGYIKLIEMSADNGDVTLALTNVVGQSSGTTATFNDVTDQLVLIAGVNKWIVLKERGIALS